MARVVFFSFDYDDVWRVNQVRQSGKFLGQRSGFRDKAQYEKVKRSGDRAIERWIRGQMQGCSVTCVLIGAETHKSRWVHFEIKESIANGMGLVGVYIHKLKDPTSSAVGLLTLSPPNPLADHKVPGDSRRAIDRFETHTWEPSARRGLLFRENDLGAWVEEAARRVGRR